MTTVLLTAVSMLLLLAGCRGGRIDRVYASQTGGDPERGIQVIAEKHCGSCHTIDQIRDARGEVGPPLTNIGRRSYLAGRLPNTPSNLVRWVSAPDQVDPQTAMPNLGLTSEQARDVAAYLYSLR